MKDRNGNTINIGDRVYVIRDHDSGMPGFTGWVRDIKPSYRDDGTLTARIDDGRRGEDHPGSNGCRNSSWSHSSEILLVDGNDVLVDPAQLNLFASSVAVQNA